MENGLKNDIVLRDVAEDDLSIIFEHQLDPDANHMAAFTAKEPADRNAFHLHWAKIMSDDTVTLKTILLGEQVVGHIAQFERFDDAEVTYWIGKEFWGKGIATQALAAFLEMVKARPLFARAARDHIASIRVLEKCGFVVSGYDRGFANARGAEIEEVIMILKAEG